MMTEDEDIVLDKAGEEQSEEMVEQFRFSVDKGQEPFRIDKFLASRLHSDISRTRIQNAADAGSILVNGKPIKSNYKIRPEDQIQSSCLRLATPMSYSLRIYHWISSIETSQVMVINKPPGLVCHPGLGNHNGTLINALLYHFAGLPKGKQEFRPGLVHRIDKDTSGLMVIAKTDYALVHLGKQFFDRTIQRLYKALVWGNVEENSGTIEGNIGRHSGPPAV
jgi:23S rRNA pseudouridine1911/1915/1917 synthase